MMIIRRGTAHSRGQAMAEFALVLPLFVLLLVGIVDGGRVVFSHNQLAEAAREGTRWGSVQGRSSTAATRDDIEARVASLIEGVPSVTVTATCERGGSTVASCHANDILVVLVEADIEMATPILGQLLGVQELSAESKVVVNQ